MINKIYCYFDFDPDTAYPIVNGPVYTDNRNEQIDSMSIVLDGITERLDFNRPYHFVKIVNKGDSACFKWKEKYRDYNAGDGVVSTREVNYTFMLIDNWVETITNLDLGIYRYEINLMNCVKLLEKIQLPNRVITHSLVNGSKTIYQYIDQYMRLYCPKVKKAFLSNDNSYWSYQYILNWDMLNTSPFNDTVAADMQMNEPTLRQLLTNLMLQVGCIPTMYNRNLSFINLREKPTPFKITDSIKNSSLSGASDSYSNTLVISPSQTLDSDNPVIAETISFRNSDSVLLKKRENLQLETRYPIYNIKRVLMSRASTDAGLLCGPLNIDNNSTDNTYPILQSQPLGSTSAMWWTAPRIFRRSDNNYYIRLLYKFNGYTARKGYLRDIKVHLCHKDSNNNYTQVAEYSLLGNWFLDFGDNTTNNYATLSQPLVISQQLLEGELGPQETQPTNSSVFEGGMDYFVNNSWCFYARIDIGLAISGVTHIWFENEFETVNWDSEYNEWVVDKLYHQVVPLSAITNDYLDESIHQEDKNSLGNTIGDYKYFIDSRVMTGVKNGINVQGRNHWYPTNRTPVNVLKLVNGTAVVDVTPLFVENNKRELLDTNFKAMNDQNTLEKLAQYIYATVGYSIGDNKITGFSSTYEQTKAWWKKEYTHFENILKFIYNHPDIVKPITDYSDNYNDEVTGALGRFGSMPFDSITSINNFKTPDLDIIFDLINSIANNSLLITNYFVNEYLFNIEYYALNSIKLKLSKKEEKNSHFNIEQLNNTDSGLTDFTRFVNNSQDTIDRTGEQVRTLCQTTDIYEDINDVNTILDDYTIFQRKITINENYVDVLYTCSKNYIMQNYFTSIITKYRAYEYVGYNSSIIRKENCTIYVLISANHYFNGDDKIYWRNQGNPGLLLTGLLNNTENYSPKYEIEQSTNENNQTEKIRNELCILNSDNILVFNYQNYDNVSAGTAITQKINNISGESVQDSSSMYLGGIIQKWQIWKQNVYNESHFVYFATKLVYTGSDDNYVESVSNFPIINNNFNYDDFIIFQYVSNGFDSAVTFYKDNAEIINQTIEFYYYTDSEDIKWTENLIKYSQLCYKTDLQKIAIVVSNGVDVYKEKYPQSLRTITYSDGNVRNFVDIVKDDNDLYYLLVKWSTIPGDTFIITLRNPEDNIYYYGDIMSFKKPERNTGEDVRYYITLNDTKTTNVLKEITTGDNAGLFEERKVLNGTDRDFEVRPGEVYYRPEVLDNEIYSYGYPVGYGFNIKIKNRNTETLTLILEWGSNGMYTDTFTLAPNTEITITGNDCPELIDYAADKDNGDLGWPVRCRFKKSNNQYSGYSVIWAADPHE